MISSLLQFRRQAIFNRLLVVVAKGGQDGLKI
jgi:hypothetical protein